MGAPWAVLGIATLSQTLPGITKASTWLTKPRVPCASFSHAPVQHPPCLGGHHPPPLLPYQEEAVLPKHVPKTLKLSGYCYIIQFSCPAPSLEPRTHTPNIHAHICQITGTTQGEARQDGLGGRLLSTNANTEPRGLR